jgi:hypothetical protein
VTPWGLLPVAVPLVWVTVRGLGALVLPRAGMQTLLAGATLTVALIAVSVRLLGAVGLLRMWVLFVWLAVIAGCVVVVGWRRRVPWRLPWRRAVSWATVPVLLVAAVAVGIAIAAAYYMPVWQWDALGYHLPFVNFALQRGAFADIPPDAPYLSTYPHTVEYLFIAWRAMLPDDRLVDMAGVPLGLLGALALATIARGQGARTDHAVAAGAVWLTLPAVFLQLPTNYVDVATAALLLAAAAFVLGPLDVRRVLLAGVAIGLLLGAKPTAVLPAVVLLAALAFRARRERMLPAVMPAALIAVVLGAETYAVNAIRYHNPVWPVRVSLGRWHLPGTAGLPELQASGTNAPRPHGNLLVRVFESWTTIFPPVPAFDMRVGGLGLVFLIALPFAVVRAVRCRSLAVALVVVASLVVPDPSSARFVLGFAGLVIALAVPVLSAVRTRWQWAGFGVLALAAIQSIVVAYPGLTGDGPRLTAYAHMDISRRQRAVGADGSPAPFLDAVAKVRPGEITAFDRWTELPYYAWPFDLSRDAQRIPDDDREIIDDPRVRMLIVGDDTVVGAAVRSDPRFAYQFHCHTGSCAVYLRR